MSTEEGVVKPSVGEEVAVILPLEKAAAQEWFEVFEDDGLVQRIYCEPEEIEARVAAFVERCKLYGFPDFQKLTYKKGFTTIKHQ